MPGRGPDAGKARVLKDREASADGEAIRLIPALLCYRQRAAPGTAASTGGQVSRPCWRVLTAAAVPFGVPSPLARTLMAFGIKFPQCQVDFLGPVAKARCQLPQPLHVLEIVGHAEGGLLRFVWEELTPSTSVYHRVGARFCQGKYGGGNSNAYPTECYQNPYARFKFAVSVGASNLECRLCYRPNHRSSKPRHALLVTAMLLPKLKSEHPVEVRSAEVEWRSRTQLA